MVKALKRGQFNLEDLTLEGVPASALTGVNADDSDPIPVLYQSGYLTIKSYDERWERYSLKYPNKEVERGFMEGLAKQSKRKKKQYKRFISSPSGVSEWVRCKAHDRRRTGAYFCT